MSRTLRSKRITYALAGWRLQETPLERQAQRESTQPRAASVTLISDPPSACCQPWPIFPYCLKDVHVCPAKRQQVVLTKTSRNHPKQLHSPATSQYLSLKVLQSSFLLPAGQSLFQEFLRRLFDTLFCNLLSDVPTYATKKQ